MNIPLEYYKAFYYVALHQSISKAAVLLQKGQPNLTKTIANLEAQLDCKLFIRSSRGMRPTPEGEKLFAHICVAMEQILAGEQELKENRSLQNGTVAIASSEVALHCGLLPALFEYHRLYPQVRIRLSNDLTHEAIESVRNHRAELAVVTAPDPLPAGFVAKKVAKIRQVAICGEAYQSLARGVLPLSELEQLPWVCLNAGTISYQVVNQFFESRGICLKPDIEVATMDQIPLLVKNNFGIGFVPEAFIEKQEGIYPLQLEEPIPAQVVSLLRRADAPLSIAAKKLEELLCRPS